MMGNMLYDRISQDNIRKYGTEYEKVLRIIINQYSDRTHFIYEILQNAEDAEATYIKFRLERDRLVIFHNGRPFNEKDIEGVCGIASGTKEDGTRIGHFGIGFKSVYCYTDRPLIYSGDHRFAIRNRLFPEEILPMAGLDASETCLILPFDREEVTPEVAFQEIKNALIKKITADSILMLDRIADVEIRIENYQNVISISKAKYPLDKKNYPDNVFGLSVQTTHVNKVSKKQTEHDEDYLFFTDAEREATAIIFRVEGKELISIRNSKIYAFFPTAKEAHQNFYIHAPFDTTPARDNFKEGAEYGKHNVKLVHNIGRLICFAFCWMRDHHYLSVTGFKNVFPIYQYEEDDVLYPLYENSIDIIREEMILPTSKPGEFKNIKDICFPQSNVIVDSFNTDDLRRLTRQRNLNWSAKEFTTEAYRDVRTFLNTNFKVVQLDWKDLVQKLDATFLQEKSLSWMEQLMTRIESYCVKKSSSDGHYINVSEIPFVRTTDKKQICARDKSGRLLVYLNNPVIAPYRIDTAFLKSEGIYSFYERALLIPKYDVQQEAIENILPKYSRKHPVFKTSNPIDENIEDLKTIKDAIYVNPSVAEKAADCYVVTDGNEWYRPLELYIRSTDVRAGYGLVKGILAIRYLSDRYFDGSPNTMKLDENFFKSLGCNYGIRQVHVSEGEYLQAAGKYCGTEIRIELRNRIFTKNYKSKKLDWAFNYEGFPKVFDQITPERSLAIARFLNPNVDQFTIQGELVGADDQHFSGKNVDSMMAYSMLGMQLCFTKWIYIDNDPNPHRPVDIDKSDIRDQYKVAKRLIAALPFKETKNAFTDWLRENIGNQGDADLVKKLFSDPAELVKLAKAKAKSDAKQAAKAGQGQSIQDLMKKGDKTQKTPAKGSDELEIASISKKALEKREQKLDKEFAESLDHFTQFARGIYFGRRSSNKEERQFLEDQYGGICQICQKRIIKYDGNPYFEAINVLSFNKLPERLSASSDLGWNSLCLCPNCAAEYNNCSKKISTMYRQIIDSRIIPDDEEPIEISIELPEGKHRNIKYSPRHFLALKRALEVFKEEQDI